MKRWKVCTGLVALLTIGTLSLGQAQWNPDTTNFYPAKVIKEMFGVFEAIKVGTNLTASEKSGNSTVVRGGKFVASNIDNPDIDGGTIDGANLSATSADLNSPDIDGGTIDGADLSATSADLNSPDIDGGTIDGSTIGSTVDIVEAEIKLDNRSSDPSGVGDGTIYLNTAVDSLRIRIDGAWRNVGQRGQGYYELITYSDPRLIEDGLYWISCTAGNDCDYMSAGASSVTSSTTIGMNVALFSSMAFCRNVKEHDAVSSYSTTVSSFASSRNSSSERLTFGSFSGAATYPHSLSTNNSGMFNRARRRPYVSGVTCADNFGTGF